MHCGAEVTESSTNKQHHLSLQKPSILRACVREENAGGRGGRAFAARVELWFAWGGGVVRGLILCLLHLKNVPPWAGGVHFSNNQPVQLK